MAFVCSRFAFSFQQSSPQLTKIAHFSRDLRKRMSKQRITPGHVSLPHSPPECPWREVSKNNEFLPSYLDAGSFVIHLPPQPQVGSLPFWPLSLPCPQQCFCQKSLTRPKTLPLPLESLYAAEHLDHPTGKCLCVYVFYSVCV